MAKAGTFAAYQRLQPNQRDLSQDLMYWNDVDARKRQQDFQEDQAEQARQERQNLRKDKLIERYGKELTADKTGSRSLDTIITNFVGVETMNTQQEILGKLLETDPFSKEGIKLQSQLQKIATVPKQLKDVNDIFVADMSNYRERVEAGTAWRDPMREKMYQNDFKDAVLMLDDNMNVVVGFADTNEDGKIDIRDEVFSYDEIAKLMPQRELIERYDIDEIVNETFKDKRVPFFDVTTSSYDGRETRTLDVNQDKLKTLSEDRYYNQIRRDEEGNILEATPSKLAVSHMIELGLEPTMENVEKARQSFEEKILNQASTINEESINASLVESNRKATKDREERTTTGTPVPSTETNWGDKFEVLDTANYQTVPIQNPRTVGTLKAGNETLTNAKITSYSVDKNDHIVVTAEVPRTKQKTEADNSTLQKMYDEETDPTLKMLILNQINTSTGSKITIPGQTERVSVILPDEDVERATGMAKDVAKQGARKDSGATATDDPLGIM